MRPRHPDKGEAVRIKWDNDDGGFTVLQGKLKEVPYGWVETEPNRFEPQWPSCRMRGLSKQSKNGVPTVTIHCNELHSIVDFDACKNCTFAKPRGHLLTSEMLAHEQETIANGGELINLSPDVHPAAQDESGVQLEYPEEVPVDRKTKTKARVVRADHEWPTCKFRILVEDDGCCPKLKCSCPGHAKENKQVFRKTCVNCEQRKLV